MWRCLWCGVLCGVGSDELNILRTPDEATAWLKIRTNVITNSDLHHTTLSTHTPLLPLSPSLPPSPSPHPTPHCRSLLSPLLPVVCTVDEQSNARNSARLLRFLKSLTDSICNPMKLDDVAELRRSITAKHNELTVKQKQQQKGNKKAATAAPGSKKANTVKVSSAGGGASAGRNTYTDELDDYGDDGDDSFM